MISIIASEYKWTDLELDQSTFSLDFILVHIQWNISSAYDYSYITSVIAIILILRDVFDKYF